jgi:hypothetical protein
MQGEDKMNESIEGSAENAQESAQEKAHDGAIALAERVEIECKGAVVTAKVHHFSALTGWEIRRQYREYLASNDPKFRIGFAIAVLSNVSVQKESGDEFLDTAAKINEELECWQNVEKMLSAQLGYNGIETSPLELERARWQVAGEDMAASFLAAVQTLIGPALTIAASKKD